MQCMQSHIFKCRRPKNSHKDPWYRQSSSVFNLWQSIQNHRSSDNPHEIPYWRTAVYLWGKFPKKRSPIFLLLFCLHRIESKFQNNRQHYYHIMQVCGKSFIQKSSFLYHTAVHAGTKKYHCTQCPYKSIDANGLRIHSRSHSGERPYHCDVCAADFKTCSNLRKHIRCKHKEEKSYEVGENCFLSLINWNFLFRLAGKPLKQSVL